MTIPLKPANTRTRATESSTTVASKRLTELSIQRLKPVAERKYYRDAGARGLSVVVYPSGKKKFVLYRKFLGRPTRKPIGDCRDLTLDAARKKAAAMNVEMDAGRDPQQQSRRLRAEGTFKELWNKYLEEYAKKHKRSWKKDLSMWNVHLAGWAGRGVSAITSADVVKLHSSMKSIPYTANRVVELIASIFAQADKQGWWTGENPARKVTPYPEQQREQFLGERELPWFFIALKQEENVTLRDFFVLAILTGQRRANLQSCRWDEIDFGREVWIIPETKAKAGKPIVVNLSHDAIRLLLSRQEEAKENCPWVFPGRRSIKKHLSEVKTAWRRILDRAAELERAAWEKANPKPGKVFHGTNFNNFRPHDLRRTHGSWMNGTGASLSMIGSALGHRNAASTKVYARLDTTPLRMAIEKATGAMAAVSAGLLGDGQ